MKYLEMNQIQSTVYALGLDNKTAELILAELGKTPTADVRHNVRARWKSYPYVWECTNCKHMEHRTNGKTTLPDNYKQYMKFCPRCGAQMGVNNEKS